MEENTIFEELSSLVTESRNPNTYDVDVMSTKEIIQLINEEDKKVAFAVEKEILYIEKAVDLITSVFKKGGRLFYIGAGTSGRLGVLDAAECPPTFGIDQDMVQGIIAGGYGALVKAVEGAEDFKKNGVTDIEKYGITKNDAVCGIAASRRTPYVIGAIEEAKKIGAKTIMIICNPRDQLTVEVDVAICPIVGPEIIMGSTRMKSATAQKMVLNMLTTTSMIKLGKVYENMMIDLQQNNLKLIERSKKIIMMASKISYKEAEFILAKSKGHVKSAILMALTNLNLDDVKSLLKKNEGFIKKAYLEWKNSTK